MEIVIIIGVLIVSWLIGTTKHHYPDYKDRK